MFDNFSIPRLLLGFISLLFIISRISKFIHKEKYQSYFKLITSLFIWLSLLLLSIFWDTIKKLEMPFNIDQDFSILVLLGFVIIFAFLFKILSMIERIESEISEIVRTLTIRKLN